MTQREAYDQLKTANRELAAKAAAYAQSIAPIGGAVSADPHPGQFRDSIHDEQAPDRKGLPASRVRSDDDGAAAIEFGTSRTPEHGTFAKTAEAFGGVYQPRVNEYKSGKRKGSQRV
jgi:hypothetical protein